MSRRDLRFAVSVQTEETVYLFSSISTLTVAKIMNSTMDDSPEIYEFRALTDFQKKLLAILPVPSSLLSIFGSSIIIVMVWKIRKTKSWIPYQRLLLAMSICDIISSMALAAGPFLYPKETSDKVWVSLDGILMKFSVI